MTNKKFFATGLATLIILSLVLFVPTKPAYAATYTIDSTGGDCSTIGVWDAKKRICTLAFDLNGSIEIAADGITLNGARHTLTGAGTGIGVFVEGQTGVAIKNVIVTNFARGIVLATSNGNTLTSNTVNSNILYGIHLTSSDANTLTSNTANSNEIGIVLGLSNGNTLTSNTANSNTDFGIAIADSNGNTLTSNTANSNEHGILLVGALSNNVLQRNTASLNIQNGFFLQLDINTVLKGNTANSNGAYGYHSDPLNPSVGLLYSKNKCSGNGSGGSLPTGLCSPQP